jgi:bifunctional UDP-N-acetylglucosamine pyrophosphorylase/glucosamine-1-phosphate N-acetyltransferase
VPDNHDWKGLVLAAGKGSRFQQETGEAFPKVLRPVLGKPLVRYVLDTLARAGVTDITLVVGFMAGEVMRELGPGYRYVLQPEQKGSGHAVARAAQHFSDFVGNLVIMCGDSPLFAADTINAIMREHETSSPAITLISAVLDDPSGYGRILRDSEGRITSIVEETCASTDQRAIKEVNGGVYAFDAKWLVDNTDRMAINEAGEYNLTDMVRIAVELGREVTAVQCDPVELLGVNTPEQLKTVAGILSSMG